MAFTPRIVKQVVEDIGGICTRPYVVGISGNLVYRALKKRLVSGALLVGTIVYLGNRAFDLDFRGLYIGLGTLGLAVAGFAAQKWAKWALKRSILYAESHGANLMEHKKQKRFEDLYVLELYDNVYALEAKVLYSPQQLSEAEKQHEQLYRGFVLARLRHYSATPQVKRLLERVIDKVEPLEMAIIEDVEKKGVDPLFLHETGRARAFMMEGAIYDLGEYAVKSRELMMSNLAFKAGVKYLLDRSDRQREESMDAGVDFSFLEDYLDGAPFHPNNTKIMEQGYHGLLKQIEKSIDKRNLGERISHFFRRYLQEKWHMHINTSVQASVGRLLYSISKQYGTHLLSVEDVLWQDEKSRELLFQELVEEFSYTDQPESIARKILQDLDEGSRQIYMKIFHDTPEEAERVIRREYGYSIQQSVYKRVRYDCEYALDELRNRPIDDLKLIGAPDSFIENTKRRMEQAQKDIHIFRDFCKGSILSDHWDRYSPEMRRALQLAYYINKDKFKVEIMRATDAHANRLVEHADQLAERFTSEASINLRRSRLHHQLAKFEYVDTFRQLNEMAYGLAA